VAGFQHQAIESTGTPFWHQGDVTDMPCLHDIHNATLWERVSTHDLDISNSKALIYQV